MIFQTRVNNIPCQCQVLEYSPAVPMHVYGTGMGDAHPPESAEFDFAILDSRGRKAPWLEKYLTPADTSRLLWEYETMELGDYYAEQ